MDTAQAFGGGDGLEKYLRSLRDIQDPKAKEERQARNKRLFLQEIQQGKTRL